MNKKIIFGIIVVVLIVVAIGFFMFLNIGEESTELIGVEETSEVRNLIVITNPWEPYIYPDKEGVARGGIVEILDLAFSRSNIPYEIRFVPWARALKELKAGEADFTLAGHTPERAEFLHYTEEEKKYPEGPLPSSFLSQSDQVFFARTVIKDAFNLESLDDILEGDFRVGAIAGYRSTVRLQDAGLNVVEYPGEEDEFLALAEREVDLVFEDKLPGYTYIKRLGLIDKITALPHTFWSDPMFLPSSKASDYPNILEAREQVLEELRKIHESGEYAEIYNKYIPE